MNIKEEAAKQAVKVAAKGWRGWIEPLRKMLTRWARKKEGKEIIVKYALVLLAGTMLTGCATIRKAAIAADDQLYDSSTARVAVPDGYEIEPYVVDSTGTERNIDGWEPRYRIVPIPGHNHAKLKDIVLRGKQAQRSQVVEIIKTVAEVSGADIKSGTTLPASGAADAQGLLIEAAKEAGVK